MATHFQGFRRNGEIDRTIVSRGVSSRHISVMARAQAHMVPLTLGAGLGHVLRSNVDYTLAGLLIGSIPAMYLWVHKSALILPIRFYSLLKSSHWRCH